MHVIEAVEADPERGERVSPERRRAATRTALALMFGLTAILVGLWLTLEWLGMAIYLALLCLMPLAARALGRRPEKM
jgi:uncharacterized membrane protein